MYNCWDELTDMSAKTQALFLPWKIRCARVSISFLAEMSLRSPQTLFIFIIYDFTFWIDVSKTTFYLIFKTESSGEGSVQQILSTVVPLIIQKIGPHARK